MDSDSADGNQGLTGFKDERGVPYTIGGDKRMVGPPSANKPSPPAAATPTPRMTPADVKLSEQISEVKIRRIDANGKIDRFGTKAVRTQMILNGKVVTFEGPLSPAGANQFQTGPLKADVPVKLQAIAEFIDEPNQRLITGTVTITEMDDRGRAMAKATIYVRSYAAALIVTPALDVALLPPNQCTVDLLKDRGFAWVTNHGIGGRSYYDIQIIAAATKSAETTSCPAKSTQLTAGHRFFSFAGKSTRTGDFPDTDAQRLEAGLLKPERVFLRGDAETQDDRTFIAILDGFQGQKIDIALRILKPDLEQVPIEKKLRGLSENSFLTVRYNDPQHAPVKAMIDDFERNYELPGVRAAIKEFVSKPEPLQGALKNALPFRAIISDVFHYFQVAPPASLVLMIESKFFTGGNYELQTNPVSSATGPFQLLSGSGRAVGMRVFDNGMGQLPPATDERLYFVPSACGAAKHFKNSLDHFSRHDRTLAILAYYQGDGGAAKFMARLVPSQNKTGNSLKDIARYRFTYRDLERQHMLPSQIRKYVNRSLALYFVTGNPGLHNFQWKEESSQALPAGKIIPRIPMLDVQCRQAVAGLVRSGVIKP